MGKVQIAVYPGRIVCIFTLFSSFSFYLLLLALVPSQVATHFAILRRLYLVLVQKHMILQIKEVENHLTSV